MTSNNIGFGIVTQGDETDDRDIYMVRQLLSALQRHRKVMSKPNLSNWSIQFKILREEVGYERSKAVMDWFCKNIGNEWLPVACSAKTFRSKFKQIEACMLADPHSVLFDCSRLAPLIERLLNEGYVFGISSESLPFAIRLSYVNARQFITELETLRDKLDQKNYKEGSLAHSHRLVHWLTIKIGSPMHFVEAWFCHWFRSLRSDWQTPNKPPVFHVMSPMFQAIGSKWTSEYCHEPQRWNELMRLGGWIK